MRICRKGKADSRGLRATRAPKGKILCRVFTRSGYVTVQSTKNISRKNSKINRASLKIIPNKIASEKNSNNTNGFPASVQQRQNICETRLNPAILETGFANSLKKRWTNSRAFSNALADFISDPFKIVVLRRLFGQRGFLEILSTELLSVPFRRLVNDLYSLEQTEDLFELNIDSPAISSFLQILKGPLFSWMKEVTGKKLSGKITVTGSKYGYTDHLLCHDDNLSDRSIAFILYLCKEWDESDGGALQLFWCNNQNQPQGVVRSIYPEFGAFAFFEVNNRSYHRVQDVLAQNKIRLSINGWFHGEELPAKAEIVSKSPKFSPPIPPKQNSLTKYIRPCWLNPQNHPDIKSMFCDQLSVSLPNFLHESIFNDLEKALLDENIAWRRLGPAHQKSYEQAKMSTLPPLVQDFLKLLKSKYMFYFLSEVTVDINPDSKTTPLCHLEVQRWSPGDYMLLVNNDPSSDITGIDVHLFFNVEKAEDRDGGTMHYMGPDKDSDGFLEDNAHLFPEKNMLFLIACIAGMQRITKYLDHCQNLHFYKIIGTYCQG